MRSSFRRVRALKRAGAPYKGVLFAGLMITKDGPQLIEYNVRFGDPECQVLMLRLMSDLVPALLAARDGQLKNFDLRWYPRRSPHRGDGGERLSREATIKGSVIEGLDEAAQVEGVEIFHAGTKAGRRPDPCQRRARAQCLCARQDRARGAEPRLRGHRPHPVAGRLLPPRYRLARDRKREWWLDSVMAGLVTVVG